MKNIESILKKEIFPIGLVVILCFSRAIPHPWNFTPVLAMGIFSGYYFKNFLLSLFVVILSMFLSDIYLGFHSTMFFTYLSLSVAVGIGALIKNFNFFRIIFAGLISSLCFFLITNFGAWLTLDMYQKNLEGLIQSYVLALPFFHNTLLSTFLYLVFIKLFLDFGAKWKIIKL